MIIQLPIIQGGLFLFVITTIVMLFIIINTNLKVVRKDNGKVKYPMAIGYSILVSFIITTFITYISIKANKQKLK